MRVSVLFLEILDAKKFLAERGEQYVKYEGGNHIDLSGRIPGRAGEITRLVPGEGSCILGAADREL